MTDQQAVCVTHGLPYTPTPHDALVSLDDGALDDEPVEGIRYEPGSQLDSGWYITSDSFDGDVASLRHYHAYHLLEVRPELVRFLGIPTGYWFDPHGRVLPVPQSDR